MVRVAQVKDNAAHAAFDPLTLQFFANYPKACKAHLKVCGRGYTTLYLYVKIAH